MRRTEHLTRLRSAAPGILPSLLRCNFGNLESEVRQLEQAGIPALHLDVMDGHFVRNLTYGMPVVSALRQMTTLPLDVHLMISRPADYIDAFYEAGADFITIHTEANSDVPETLRRIRQLGAGAGIALTPQTQLADVEPYHDLVDLVLVMSVDAGFGGQEFNPIALDKLRSLAQIPNREFLLEVDGGVNTTTVGKCTAAGAELLVVGSAIFGEADYANAVGKLSQLAAENAVI